MNISDPFLDHFAPVRTPEGNQGIGGFTIFPLLIRDDDADVEGGFNVLVGLQHRQGLFTEFKVGAIDSPSVKFTVGYAF